MALKCVDFVLPSVRFVDLYRVLVLHDSQFVTESLELRAARLEAHLCVSLAYLELFGAADFVLVGLVELRLSLLVPAVLLLEVADFVVELF